MEGLESDTGEEEQDASNDNNTSERGVVHDDVDDEFLPSLENNSLAKREC